MFYGSTNPLLGPSAQEAKGTLFTAPKHNKLASCVLTGLHAWLARATPVFRDARITHASHSVYIRVNYNLTSDI